jgi:hypothetical protein
LFEKLFNSSNALIASHEDINDLEQMVILNEGQIESWEELKNNTENKKNLKNGT